MNLFDMMDHSELGLVKINGNGSKYKVEGTNEFIRNIFGDDLDGRPCYEAFAENDPFRSSRPLPLMMSREYISRQPGAAKGRGSGYAAAFYDGQRDSLGDHFIEHS